MSIHHHPSEAILTAYASGALADGPSLGVAAHLERCAQCRAEVQALESLGGALLQDMPDTPMQALALDQALAQIERPALTRVQAAPDRRSFAAALPRALQARRIGRRRYVAPNLWVAHVQSNAPDGWRTYLLHAGPGQGLLDHGHQGCEMTMVLSGAFRDDTGLYRSGDFIECGMDLEHQPKVDGDAACLCLIAAEAGVRVRGLARLLQPLLQV